jgi:hypothetical protein
VKKALVVLLAIVTLAAGAWAAGPVDNMLGPHNTNGTFGCQSCHAPHSQVLAGSGTYMWGLSVPQGTYTTYGANLTNGTPIAGAASLTTNLTSGTGADTSVNTVLCLSCHDQTFNAIMAGGQPTSPTTNMGSTIANFTGAGDGSFTTIGGGVANSAFNIASNHPVHVLYPNIAGAAVTGYDAPTAYRYWALTAAGSFNDNGSVFTYGHTARIFMNGTAAYIECGSCHNPHSQNVAVVSVNGTNQEVGSAHFIRGEYDNTQTQTSFCISCHADKSVAWNGTGAQ